MEKFFLEHFFFSIFMIYTCVVVFLFHYLSIKKRELIIKMFLRFNVFIITIAFSMWLLSRFVKPNLDFILVPYFFSALFSIISAKAIYRIFNNSNFLTFIYLPNFLMCLLYSYFEFVLIPKLWVSYKSRQIRNHAKRTSNLL